MTSAIFGIATSRAQAESVVTDLREAGFTGNDISVLFPDDAGTRDFAHEKHTKAPEGAATGATALKFMCLAASLCVRIWTIICAPELWPVANTRLESMQ